MSVGLLRDCVKQMLQYDMDQRPTSKELMDHKWFEGVDWEEVPKKKTKSPVVIKEGKAHVDQRMMLDEYMRDQVQPIHKRHLRTSQVLSIYWHDY
tara:strand:+ start:170 stop:454 length:285 start_codon:yes stop_codon:yes gene_type:complete